MPAASDFTTLGHTAAHARQELLLLLPRAERRRAHAAGDHTRQSKVDLAGCRRRDAAKRQRALADLAPPGDVALVRRSLAAQLFDCGKRFLAQLRGLDRLGCVDDLGENLHGLLWGPLACI